MKVIGTVLILLLCMPTIHVILFGPRNLGTTTFYYWLGGIPTLMVLVPLAGFPLLGLLRSFGLHGFPAIFGGTIICSLIAALAMSFVRGVIPKVIAIAAVFGGIGGFAFTALAQVFG